MKLEDLIVEDGTWSGPVTQDVTSHSKDGLYATGTAQEIADEEEKREGSPGAAIKAIDFYINRAGSNLSEERLKVAHAAAAILHNKLAK